MTADQIKYLIDHRTLPYPTDTVELIETHISWVLLATKHVYKIKKPLKFSFLDFSTLSKRKEYCEKEVELNRRLAPSMYLGVLPVTESNGTYCIGNQQTRVKDYAVLMKRMDETRQMDLLLQDGTIKNSDIINLADTLASFHKQAEVVPEGEDWRQLYTEFEDLNSVKDFLVLHFGNDITRLIDKLNHLAYQFLTKNRDRIEQRNRMGYVVDGHGDLHARNIFLLDEPVIFDCIEFNDDFRKLDLLSEIAFLCMDLERFARFDLSRLFLKHYLYKIQCIENKTDEQLFLFYKMYRANIRMKIHAINAQKIDITDDLQRKEMELITQYLKLFRQYSEEFKK